MAISLSMRKVSFQDFLFISYAVDLQLGVSDKHLYSEVYMFCLQNLTGSCLSDQGDHFKTQGLSTRHSWNMLPINVCQNLDPRRMPGRVLS
jgi:hypothetical protein